MTGKGSLNHNSRKFHAKNTDPNRTHWNVNYASKSIFDDLKDKFVNDEIELVVKLKATKQ